MMLIKHYDKDTLELDFINDLITSIDDQLVPSLSSEMNIHEYSKKLQHYAKCVMIEEEKKVVAFIFYYIINSLDSSLFITLICSTKSGTGRIIYDELIDYCNPKFVILEVDPKNLKAIRFYDKIGFKIDDSNINVKKFKLIHRLK